MVPCLDKELLNQIERSIAMFLPHEMIAALHSVDLDIFFRRFWDRRPTSSLLADAEGTLVDAGASRVQQGDVKSWQSDSADYLWGRWCVQEGPYQAIHAGLLTQQPVDRGEPHPEFVVVALCIAFERFGG